jgi:hypothetical protein
MKLVFINDPGMAEPVLAWNTLDTAESLTDQGLPCEAIAPRLYAKPLEGDVFIFYRTMQTDSFTRMRELQARGKPCGFMIDDIVWDPKYDFAYAPNFESQCRRFFQHADFFVFTSEKLAEVSRPMLGSKKVYIRRPGILERRFFNLSGLSDKWRDHRTPGTFRILISKGHITSEFQKMVSKIFYDLQGESFLHRTEVCYFSHENLFNNLGNGITVTRNAPCSFDRYLDQIAMLAPDLILCPFKQTEFNDCKCYPKYLEGGAISAPLLVSNIYPYRKVIRNGDNGILSDESELAQVLLFSAKHRDLLYTMGLNSREDVRSHYLLGPIALKFYNEMNQNER